MKIGIDARNLVPERTGIGRYLFEMCRHLASRGDELFLYLPEKPISALPQWPGTAVRIGNYPGGVMRMIWGQTALPRLASKDEVDVFWGPAHRLPRFLDPNIPRVVTIHDLVWVHAAETMRLRTWLAERVLMKPALESADRIVADSGATADALKMLFPRCAGKTSIIYPGLSAIGQGASKDVLKEHHIDRSYVLFVGTHEPRKNLPNLLEAYARLPEEIRRKLLLVIAGGQGWRLGDLRQHIARLGIEPFVRLTGYVSDDELAGLYANARFLAMPSFYEGFGFPIIEANAAGIPVLTSNSSSMPEVAGDAALLVDPADVQSMAGGLARLAGDDALYEKLSAKARANAARFSWEKSADELLAVFHEAIELRAS
ncbi:glycosyltransferase family 1 protein [Phyllobacterium phragmitis]|uniref:Glycosyltransferase family 1 protein n=1 Tax=Phyllobacterium phragmitis TaxID=2670329 RepID=A0A2S9IZ07_9HYPH|nr:glycosyltransferase family 1 protein [Phyllobacterium phragmitis]PRD45762.1 glycosyltransferase family 1 protein [Phyllobacterium phragmitis]